MNRWFLANKLTLNFDKTFLLNFTASRQSTHHLQIGYNNNYINEINCTKFLGLHIDNTLSWKHHIEHMIPKLSSACFAIRTLKFLKSINILKSVYFAYFHSIMSYGLIFWGNSCESKNIFLLQKRVLRIIANVKKTESCKELFKTHNILPLACEYILALITYTVDNFEHFVTNSNIHGINTRNKLNLHKPTTHLTLYQKGVFYSAIQLFNHCPHDIKMCINNKHHLKKKLKKFLLSHAFYTVEEFINFNKSAARPQLIVNP